MTPAITDAATPVTRHVKVKSKPKLKATSVEPPLPTPNNLPCMAPPLLVKLLDIPHHPQYKLKLPTIGTNCSSLTVDLHWRLHRPLQPTTNMYSLMRPGFPRGSSALIFQAALT